MHGSVDTLLSSVSKPNSGRSVVLDRVDVFVIIIFYFRDLLSLC